MSSKSRLKLILQSIKNSGSLSADAFNMLTDEEKKLVQTLYDEGLVEESLSYINTLNIEEDWDILKKQLVAFEVTTAPVWKSVLRYAAIFIGLFVFTYFFHMYENFNVGIPVSENSIKLKLGDNRIKIIGLEKNEQIVGSSGEIIAEHKGNTIRYKANSDINELVFNELDIPNGQVLDLELSDGTVIHLNSGTKIKYPVKFLKGKKREVFIHGEAYFEVAKDKGHPFIVNAEEVAIEVLGTKFNVSTYQEDAEIMTVLVEGSVRMSNSISPKNTLLLSPGTKGSWDKTEHRTKMEEVDVEIYTGWVKGELIFRNSTFKNMLKKLERSYNVQIDINNPALADKVLTANFSVEIESIEDVLKSIKEVYPFHYEITDEHILVF